MIGPSMIPPPVLPGPISVHNLNVRITQWRLDEIVEGTDAARIVGQGQGAVSRNDPRRPSNENFLVSPGVQSCVVVTIYEPTTARGGMYHLDTNSRDCIKDMMKEIKSDFNLNAPHDIRFSGGQNQLSWYCCPGPGGIGVSLRLEEALADATQQAEKGAYSDETDIVAMNLANGELHCFRAGDASVKTSDDILRKMQRLNESPEFRKRLEFANTGAGISDRNYEPWMALQVKRSRL